MRKQEASAVYEVFALVVFLQGSRVFLFAVESTLICVIVAESNYLNQPTSVDNLALIVRVRETQFDLRSIPLFNRK